MAIRKEYDPIKEKGVCHRYVYLPGYSGEPDVFQIGSKALHNTELQDINVPVPPFFVMTTEGWKDFYRASVPERELPPQLQEQLSVAIMYLEHEAGGKHFGDNKRPLCVSVRSGAPVSMPGAMHTIINVGITEENVHVLGQEIGPTNAHYAHFTLIRSLGKHAFHIPDEEFSDIRDVVVGHDPKSRPNIDKYKELVTRAKAVFESHGFTFPNEATEQLAIAIDSVYRSWDMPEAMDVRFARNIQNDLGTAVMVEEMVWGNSDRRGAGSGVLFTQNPTTGEKTPIVLFAQHEQGYKVVGDRAKQKDTSLNQITLPFRIQLLLATKKISQRYQRPQEVEFTIDGKKLHVLQTRDVDLSSVGELKWCIKQMKQGRLSEEEAKKRLSLLQLEQLLAPGLDPKALQEARKEGRCIGNGIALSPTWDTGKLVFSIEQAKMYGNTPVILSNDVTPKDFRELPPNVVGANSETGSVGSHKARAATRLNATVIFGIKIDPQKTHPGRLVTISGETGEIFLGKIGTKPTNNMLTPSERKLVESWRQERVANPWLFVTTDNGIDQLVNELQRVLVESQARHKSRKAHGIEVFNAAIPSDIRIPYTTVSKHDEPAIRQRALSALATGSDVTIRTCRHPDTRGKSPYVVITSEAELHRFFLDHNYSEKYGGWPVWKEDPSITEVVVGQIPKNKLNPDYFPYLCNWTLSCVGDKIILQIVPGSPLLRSQEEVKPADMITIEAEKDFSEPLFGLRFIRPAAGENLTSNRPRERFYQLVTSAVFDRWWREKHIALRMAALTSVLSHRALVPALEGQASLIPGQEYVIVYGGKLDYEEDE